MSNRAFASRYTGAPEVRSSGSGGGDLFGIQYRRQKDIMALQQAQELEKMREAEKLQEQGTTQQGDIESKARIQAVGLKAASDNGLVPPGTTFDVLSPKQQNLVNTLGETHLALQQQTQDSPAFQDAFKKGAAALQAKPVADNNETAARTRALSTTMLPANTGAIIGAPNGNFNDNPLYASGPTQTINMVGGVLDKASGRMVGQSPVETYGKSMFPPIANLSPGGDSQNLTNNVQTKPTASNVSSTPTDPFANPQLDAILNQHPQQPTPSPVATKPPQSQVGSSLFGTDNNPVGQSVDALAPLIKYLMQRQAMSPQTQSVRSSPFGLH